MTLPAPTHSRWLQGQLPLVPFLSLRKLVQVPSSPERDSFRIAHTCRSWSGRSMSVAVLPLKTHPREMFWISLSSSIHVHTAHEHLDREGQHINASDKITLELLERCLCRHSCETFRERMQRSTGCMPYILRRDRKKKGFFGLCRGSCGDEALTVALAQCTVVHTCCENSMSGNIRVGPRSNRSGTARSHRISKGFRGVQKLIQSVLKGDGVVVEGI